MNTNMKLVDVIAFTDANRGDVERLKASDEFNANAQAIANLRQSAENTAIQLDEGVSFVPYDDGLELSLWTPAQFRSVHNMIGVFSQVTQDFDNGGLKRTPQRLLIGRDAKFVIVLESDCTCCAEKHALIIDSNETNLSAIKRYSPLENKNVGHNFEIAFKGSSHDLTGQKLTRLLTDLRDQKKPTHHAAPKPKKHLGFPFK